MTLYLSQSDPSESNRHPILPPEACLPAKPFNPSHKRFSCFLGVIFIFLFSIHAGPLVCQAETLEAEIADTMTAPVSIQHPIEAPLPETMTSTPADSLPDVTAPSTVAAPLEAESVPEGPPVADVADAETPEDEITQPDLSEEKTPGPAFALTYHADLESVDTPATIGWTLRIENIGGISLTKITIDNSLPKSFFGQEGHEMYNGVLGVGETWTFVGEFPVTQEIIDGNGVNTDHVIDGNGNIGSKVSVSFAEAGPQEAGVSVPVIQAPSFNVTQQADIPSINKPETITFTTTIENTGNLSLTGLRITAPLLGFLSGPEGDGGAQGILDVGETWTYTGTYRATQAILDANGVDTHQVVDADGDINCSVMVSFAEIAASRTAHAAVAVNLPITADIFEKKYRLLHGFVSATRLYTTNLYRTDENPESCWATFLTPGIWATYPSEIKRSVDIITANASPGGLAVDSFNPSDWRRFQFYALYSPQMEIYHGQGHKAYQDPDLGAGVVDDGHVQQGENAIRDLSGQDSVNRLTHRIDAMVHYHSGNKLAVRAMNQHKISYDVFSERTYWTDDKFTSNMFNIAGTLDATEKLQLRLDYTNFRLDYRDAISGDDDRMDGVYAAYLFFLLTGKTSVFLEYDFADIDYRVSRRDSREHRYWAGLRWEMTGKSKGQLKGGYGRRTTGDSPMIDEGIDILSDRSDSNWIIAVQIDHNITSRINMTLNAYRRFDEVLEHRYTDMDTERFYADYILGHFGGVKLSWNPVSSIHLNLDASLLHDKFIDSRRRSGQWRNVDEDRKDLGFAVSPTMTIDLFNHCSINGGYIYSDHDSNYPDHDYFEHVFFIRASLFI